MVVRPVAARCRPCAAARRLARALPSMRARPPGVTQWSRRCSLHRRAAVPPLYTASTAHTIHSQPMRQPLLKTQLLGTAKHSLHCSKPAGQAFFLESTAPDNTAQKSMQLQVQIRKAEMYSPLTASLVHVHDSFFLLVPNSEAEAAHDD